MQWSGASIGELLGFEAVSEASDWTLPTFTSHVLALFTGKWDH